MVHIEYYLYRKEFRSTLEAIYNANEIEANKFNGDVLYVGMGNRYSESMHTSDVTSTTYIEINEEIISNYGYGTKVIKGDAFEVELEEKFDVIFLDIWNSSEKESELIRLKERFENNLKEEGKFLHLKTVFAADIKTREINK